MSTESHTPAKRDYNLPADGLHLNSQLSIKGNTGLCLGSGALHYARAARTNWIRGEPECPRSQYNLNQGLVNWSSGHQRYMDRV